MKLVFFLITLAISLPINTLNAGESEDIAQLKIEIENLKSQFKGLVVDSPDSKCWFSGNHIFRNGQYLGVGDAGAMINLIDSGACTYRDEPKECILDWYMDLDIDAGNTKMVSDNTFDWFGFAAKADDVYDGFQAEDIPEQEKKVIASFRRLNETLRDYGLCKVSQKNLNNHIETIHDLTKKHRRLWIIRKPL